ncbi:aspartate/glutamate racemase family protein [Janthinobacterium sp. GW460P]|uniref:aspartate/glutamate racemase family protein n=1 Tax=unclassified Janthinobacterium TaxID=2610881 RepID=UPI000A3259AA|nr:MULTISPECIES: aspartate/glutamate racemase family protein [unclassified Janthinobacterium]MCC7705545.1 aspartate/glutamate racemase family protein [Janthinobacterium sp. GW460P]MCC7711007.1 aspartate/glutamate racemase family protein [Janthinobacterium sp. GW460W]
MRTIGLIGGMSWESSAEYYRIINQGVRARLGPLRSAPLLLYSVDFGPVEQAQHAERWHEAAAILCDAARRLQAGGAEAIVLCTNTMHRLAEDITAAVPLPFLHIADPVAHAACQRGLRTVGLLGTAFTMQQPFLRTRLEAQGLAVLVPPEAAQPALHAIIYAELCAGIVRTASREVYRHAIDALAARGAQAVILGCTEISLLLQQQHSVLPLLDSTLLHAHAAVDFVLDGEG